MKTILRALRMGQLTLACLVIAAITVFDFWAAGYCYRHRDQTRTPQTSSEPVPADFNLPKCWLGA